MHSPIIVCIVGPSCAGKTTAASMLAALTEAATFQASSFARARFRNSGSKLNLLDFVGQEFTEKGMDTFARDVIQALMKEITMRFAPVCIIDGFRTVEEVELVRSELGTCHVVAIYADSRVRFERNLSRNRGDAIVDYLSFIRKDFVECSFGIAPLVATHADTILVNERDLTSLQEEIKRTRIDLCLPGRN